MWIKLIKEIIKNRKGQMNGFRIPDPSVIISLFISLTILVAIGAVMIKPNADGDNTFNQLEDFGVGVVNSTVGQNTKNKLLPDSVVPLVVIGLMIIVGTTVLGFNYLRRGGGAY